MIHFVVPVLAVAILIDITIGLIRTTRAVGQAATGHAFVDAFRADSRVIVVVATDTFAHIRQVRIGAGSPVAIERAGLAARIPGASIALDQTRQTGRICSIPVIVETYIAGADRRNSILPGLTGQTLVCHVTGRTVPQTWETNITSCAIGSIRTGLALLIPNYANYNNNLQKHLSFALSLSLFRFFTSSHTILKKS